MKTIKLFMITCVVTLGFTACHDDNDVTIGAFTNADSLNVVVVTDPSVVMPSTATSFDITLQRNKDNGSISVPLSFYCGATGIFTGPETVNFASGELEKTITVNVSDNIQMFKDYLLEVVVDENYTIQYAATTDMEGAPRALFTVVKEDYKVVKQGVYYSDWIEDEEPAELEYSEILDSYRFNKQTSGAFTFTFSLGEADEEGTLPITYDDDFINNGSATSEDWADSVYGIMTMKGSTAEESYYDPDTKTYWFDIKYTVAAGSFGNYYDHFTEQ